MLGMSERTFRRWRDRYEAEGADGLYDRRFGRVSARRAGADEVLRMLELFETRYADFTAHHFWEKLVGEHAFKRSYNRVRVTLQAHGLSHAGAAARGAPPQAAAAGAGAGARISRRPPGRLPWTQVSRPLRGRRHPDREPQGAGRVIRFDATGRSDLWTSGQLGSADLTTSPQAQQPQQKRSIHMVHKPVNSVCYRHSGRRPPAARVRSDRSSANPCWPMLAGIWRAWRPEVSRRSRYA